jgi:type IV secretory pathway VirJ component
MEKLLTLRKTKQGAAALAGVALLVIAWSAWLGWFGGALFTDVPAAAARGPITVIFFSGDLGFKMGMGPKIAARLAARGIPVVGVNSLVFFNRRRSAAETAGLIEAAMAEAARRTGGGPVALVGQSFGADMLPIGLSALPPRARSRVALIALVVPGEKIQFVTSPADIFTFASAETSAVATAKMLDWAPLLCIQGMEETASLCPHLGLPNLTRVALPGGHMLHYDVDRIAAVLAGAIGSVGAPSGPVPPRLAASIAYPKKGP